MHGILPLAWLLGLALTVAPPAAAQGQGEAHMEVRGCPDDPRDLVTASNYTVNGVALPPGTGLDGQVEEGDRLRVDFTLEMDCQERFTLVSYRAGPGSMPTLHVQDSAVLGIGDHSLEVDVPACSFQVAWVAGPAIEQSEAPLATYTAEERLIDGDAGGSRDCPAPQPPAPQCPAEVMATVVEGGVLVEWTSPASADAIRIHRSATGGELGELLVAMSANQSQYLDASVAPDRTYWYTVLASNGGGESQGCGAAVATTPPPPPPLECPREVTALPQPDGSIRLTFTPPAHGDGLRVYRGASPSVLLAALPPDATSYLDTDTEVGRAYTYMVVSYRGEEQSEGCATAEATAIPEFPSAIALGLAGAAGLAAFARRRP